MQGSHRQDSDVLKQFLGQIAASTVGSVKPAVPNVLAARYASEAMAQLWSAEHKIVLERRLWLAVLRAQDELGVSVPPEVIDAYESVVDQVDWILACIFSTGARSRVGTVPRVMPMTSVRVKLPVMVAETASTLVTGAERDPNGPLSVVGAGVIAGEMASSSSPIVNRVAGIVGLLGSLNIALFVFNLVPLLPLDGGHVVVALWDGIKKWWARIARRPAPRPVDATKLVPLTFVVVAALAVMGGVLILADLINPLSLI